MEIEHRKNLSEYALNDCLSMEMIIHQMKMKKFKFNYDERTRIRKQHDLIELSSISSNDDNEDNIMVDTRVRTSRMISIIIGNNQLPNISTTKQQFAGQTSNQLDFNRTILPSNEYSTDRTILPSKEHPIDRTISFSNEHPIDRTILPSKEHPIEQTQTLTIGQRKKIHNRRCTRKQRKRLYRNEIILRNIDRRFRIKQIKQILRERNIIPCAINTSTSQSTHRTSLFIGITDRAEIPRCKDQIKNLFTIEHYKRLCPQNDRTNYRSGRANHRENHYHY